MLKIALTIAGTDPTGGAGIQADIKTMSAHGVYAMSIITALVAQSTQGVKSIFETTPTFLGEQFDAVFEDITPHAVKIGMVSSSPLIHVIASKLKQYKPQNIVVDPVMVATAGSRLMADEALHALKTELFPLATVLTPNIPEAEILVDFAIHSPKDMERAAEIISQTYHCAVLVKGGHDLNDANDCLWHNGKCSWLYGKKINNPNTHGTGCTLSSAIAANLAQGQSLDMAVKNAKDYVSNALSAMLNLGKGRGPLNHLYGLKSPFIDDDNN